LDGISDRPDRSAKPELQAALYEGKLEVFSATEIRGWVWDKNNTDQAVFISLFLDGALYCTVVADEFRMDLKIAEKRSGCCSFRVRVPCEKADGKPHHVRATVLLSEPEFVIGEISTKIDGVDAADQQPFTNRVMFHNRRTVQKPTPARGLIGKRGWLFLADDSNNVRDQIAGQYPLNPMFFEQYRRVFAERKRRLADLGIPYLFFIAPTKELICKDRLPSDLPIESTKMPSSQVAKVLAHDGMDICALEPVLLEEEKIRETFYRTDTHWNYWGALRAYQEIIRAAGNFVNCGSPFEGTDFRSKIIKGWRGDLANKEKVFFAGPEYDLLPCSLTAFDAEAFCEDVEQLLDGSGEVSDSTVPDHLKVSRTRETIVKVHRNSQLPKLMVFRDSFSTLLAPMIARNFSQSIFIWRPELNFSLVEREKPDIVIQIMVDRFMVKPPLNIQ
jgi:alginate O-acetyltransferase complex protein AlgJ